MFTSAPCSIKKLAISKSSISILPSSEVSRVLFKAVSPLLSWAFILEFFETKYFITSIFLS